MSAVVALIAASTAACQVAGQDEAVTAEFVEGMEFTYQPVTFDLEAGEPARIEFENVGAVEHTLTSNALAIDSGVVAPGESVDILVTPEETGTYEFYCTIPGHREAGMVGTIFVTGPDQGPDFT